MRKIDTTLYFITDSTGWDEDEFLRRVELALMGGATIMQLREKNRTTREYMALAEKVHTLAKKYQVPLIIDDRVDVALAVGWFGELTVIRDLSMKEPYVGRSEMISGEIAEDFANYFTRSEQTPSLVYLGVRVDIETLKVLSAGGMLIQAMPNCPEEAIAAIEAKADDISKLALRLEKGEELRDILINMFEGCTLEILGSAQPEYRCDCSRERLEAVLMSLGKEELTDIIEKEGQAELTCRFCNKVYHFTKEQLEAILKEGAGNSDERSDTE